MGSLYHAKAKSDALRKRASAEIARLTSLLADAQAKLEQADRIMADYLTQPQLPEFEKAKAALDAGAPSEQVIEGLRAFCREHLKPLDYRFFERRDDASRAPVLARISEISAWCSEQKRRLDQEASSGALTPEEIRRINGESA